MRRTMMGTLRGQLEATQAENKRLQTRIAQLETQYQVWDCDSLTSLGRMICELGTADAACASFEAKVGMDS